MRKLMLSIAGLLMVCASLMAQTPAAFKYQAVARNASGEVMADKTMNVRIGLYKGVSSVYSEVHTVTTNDLGLFTLEVGRGSPESGNFLNIDWGAEPHFVRIEIDPNGSGNFMFLGMSELLSVPYARHSETVEHNDDADSDPENEIQDLKVVGSMLRITNHPNPTVIDMTQFSSDDQALTYDQDNRVLNLEDGGSVNLSNLANDADADPQNEIQTLSQTGTTVTLSNGGGSISVEDQDADPANELQTLSLNGNTITLSNGGGSIVMMDDDPINEIQDLSINNNYLNITNNPNATVVDLNPFMDNTDAQTISLNGSDLSISGGNTVDMSVFMDDTDTDTDDQQIAFDTASNTLSLQDGGAVDLSSLSDEMQTVSQNGLIVTLSHGGGTFSIADDDNNPMNEIQDLLLVDDTLVITGNPLASLIDLGPYKDNTDSQTISLAGTDLSISGGNTVDISSVNTDAQTLSISNDSMVISGGNAVDLSPYLDDTDTDDQTLSLSGTDLSIADGNTVDMSSFMDNTDAQTLSISNDSMVISGGNAVDLSPYLDNTDAQDMTIAGNTLSLTGDATTVDLSGYMDNTDAQTLSISNDSMVISGGNAVDLSPYLDNTDTQDLTIAGNTLSLTGDATTVDLSGYMDNTDAQTLSISNDSMVISGGNSVDLSPYLDNTDAQDMTIAGNTLSLTGDATTVDLSGYMDNTDAQTLSISNDSMVISGGNAVDLSPYLDNTDTQDLTIAGNTLSLTGDATTVDLSGYMDNTDAQDLTIAGNTLSLTGDATTVDLSSYLDNTDAQTLSISNDSMVISGGNAVDLSAYLDNTDAQDLTIAGNTLSLTGDATTVDLSGYMDNTDAQDLTIAGNTLSLTGDATTVDLSSYLDNTDAQTLSISNDSMVISGGNAVDLSAYLDNTDAQDLTIAGNTLSLTGDATTVDLSSYLDADDLGSHIATQNIEIVTHYISNDGDNEGIRIGTNGNVTASTNFFVGETAGTNSDIYISGWLFDWDDNTYAVDPNNTSKLKDVTVETELTVNGAVTVKETAITSNYTAGSEFVIQVDATSGNVTVSLPAAASNDGRMYIVKRMDASGNTVTIDGSGAETIDGAATRSLAVQYDYIKVVCDGSQWLVVGQ